MRARGDDVRNVCCLNRRKVRTGRVAISTVVDVDVVADAVSLLIERARGVGDAHICFVKADRAREGERERPATTTTTTTTTDVDGCCVRSIEGGFVESREANRGWRDEHGVRRGRSVSAGAPA